jgi:hypothetical protein
MSIGNTNTQGNKKNNFPYQLASLQLLGEIAAAVNGSVGRMLNPMLTSSTGAGNLTASNIVYSAAAVTLTVSGNTVSIPAGTTINYDPGVNNYYKGSDFSWDATGSTLLVSYTN